MWETCVLLLFAIPDLFFSGLFKEGSKVFFFSGMYSGNHWKLASVLRTFI
jgi:hypothetical protein